MQGSNQEVLPLKICRKIYTLYQVPLGTLKHRNHLGTCANGECQDKSICMRGLVQVMDSRGLALKIGKIPFLYWPTAHTLTSLHTYDLDMCHSPVS